MHRVFIWLLMIGIITIGYAAYADTIVTLQPATQVNRPAIRLSDVFTGVPQAIDRDIATAPAPGKSVTYDVRVLTKLADQYRLEWQPQSLADSAVLTRAGTRITADMIRNTVIEKLAEQDVTGKIEIMFDNRGLEVVLPADREPEFVLNNFDYDRMNKRFRSDLMASTGATPVLLPVQGRVLIKRDVPVLIKRLAAGTTVGAADLDWMTVADEQINGDVVTTADQLIGRELRHDTGEGQLLRIRDIIMPRLVTRGSLVTMKIETPVMLITTQGRALQDGGVGDVVRVTNTQSNRTVEGTVEASGVVRMITTQKLAAAE